MWQRFTELARKIVFNAQEEAQSFGEGYVSTEHLLLGMLREKDCVACRVIVASGVSLNEVKEELEKHLAKSETRTTQDMTLTPRAKRVIDLAYEEARSLQNNYIGTEHLFLGLIREGDGMAGRVLQKLGLEVAKSRNLVVAFQQEDSNSSPNDPPNERSDYRTIERRSPKKFSSERYDSMLYRHCGRSGLKLPAISLGAWETFGGYRDLDVARDCFFAAFDLGITHFDLANNYGSPPGNAEVVCGKIIQEMPRDELIISSKAGYTMWPGPYGDWGSRKYMIASCDQSLKRMGLDYFDIFYSHRFDPETPLEETMGALDTLVKQGKALYAGISNYNGVQSRAALEIVQENRLAPITIHQPYANMLSRSFETDLAPLAAEGGFGMIAYCPLASGILTDKYLANDIPTQSRAAQKWGKNWVEQNLTSERLHVLTQLNGIAASRGQTLAQLALAWLVQRPQITSALIGASSKEQVEENVKALENLEFSKDEITTIDALLVA